MPIIKLNGVGVATVALAALAMAQPAAAVPGARPADQDSVRIPVGTGTEALIQSQDTIRADATRETLLEGGAGEAVRDALVDAAQDTTAAPALQAEQVRAPANFATQYVKPRLMVSQERLRLTLQQDRVQVPFQYRSRMERTGRSLNVSPVVHVQGGGMRYDPELDALRGSLSVIVQDPDSPVSNEPLSQAIWLQFISDAGPVVPDTLQLGHAGRPPRRVELRTQTTRDTVHVQVFGDPSSPPAEIPVPVWQPHIEVDVSEQPHGLGFEAAVVTVHMPRVFGPGERVVTLHPSTGSVEPQSLRLAGGADGTARWRSRGIGEATISASTAGFQSRSEPVQFVWPVPFLVASLLGAILGSLATQLGATRRYAKVGLDEAVGKGFSGLVAGLVTSVAFAIGINLTGLDIQVAYGEAAAFVLAALGAIYGLPGLGRTKAAGPS